MEFNRYDKVTWGIKVENHPICWTFESYGAYTYLCTNTKGVHVLETPATGEVFTAHHVKKVE
mgnify:CR=1 FL=1